jgi:hypothetical protein
MKGIPTVKTWQITLVNGSKAIVLAPTKRLALLNYRFDGHFEPIKSIGLLLSRANKA